MVSSLSEVLCPHSRVEGFAIDQDTVSSGPDTFHPTYKAALAGQGIDLVKTAFPLTHKVNGIFRTNYGTPAAFISEAAFGIDKKVLRSPPAHVPGLLSQILNYCTLMNVRTDARILKNLMADYLFPAAIEEEPCLRTYVCHLTQNFFDLYAVDGFSGYLLDGEKLRYLQVLFPYLLDFLRERRKGRRSVLYGNYLFRDYIFLVPIYC